MKAISKPGYPQRNTGPPITSRGALYYGSDDSPDIYLFGGTVSKANTSFPGFKPPLSTTYTMWSFITMTYDWKFYDMTENVQNGPSAGTFSTARDQNRSFWLNGQVDSGSSVQTTNLESSTSIFQPGLIVINHDDQTARNISTEALVGKKPRTRGRTQWCVGLGTNGILLLIGGNHKIVADTVDRGVGDLVPMDRVHVFDVSSIYDERVSTGGTWYEQPVTGDIPQRRVDFCVMKASAADLSSFNIYMLSELECGIGDQDADRRSYMYGGLGANNVIFDDIYVLSMPSFTWTKVYQGDSGRYGHTCHRASQREMISVGGAPTTDLSMGRCDWRTRGIHVFDLSTATWSSRYNRSQGNYFVPSAVVGKIGGNGQGNATMRAPAGGFADLGLARIFGSDFVSPSSAAMQPGSSASEAGKHSKATKRAMIAGVAVGGSVLLVLSIAAGWIFRGTLHEILIGDLGERLEMDGKGKSMSELPAKGTAWELPGNEPAELWSPTTTTTPTSSAATDDFKHETRSDRELGWRGEIECEGDVSRTECVIEEKSSEDDASLDDARSSCKGYD